MAHSPPKWNPTASLNGIILASVVVHVEKLFEPLQELEVVLKPEDRDLVQNLVQNLFHYHQITDIKMFVLVGQLIFYLNA